MGAVPPGDEKLSKLNTFEQAMLPLLSKLVLADVQSCPILSCINFVPLHSGLVRGNIGAPPERALSLQGPFFWDVHICTVGIKKCLGSKSLGFGSYQARSQLCSLR